MYREEERAHNKKDDSGQQPDPHMHQEGLPPRPGLGLFVFCQTYISTRLGIIYQIMRQVASPCFMQSALSDPIAYSMLPSTQKPLLDEHPLFAALEPYRLVKQLYVYG
jgi:hypothetical protein